MFSTSLVLLTPTSSPRERSILGSVLIYAKSFKFASPVEVLRATDVYCSSYYGSMAGWELGGDTANTFYNSWSVNVKLAWDVPRQTRKYLLQHVLAAGFTSARTEILSRYVGFFRSLCLAPSHEVRTAALLAGRDLWSVTGRNLRLLHKESGQDPWTISPSRIRECLTLNECVPIPETDMWRVRYLHKLLERRQLFHYQGEDKDRDRISDILNSLCINWPDNLSIYIFNI